MFICSCCGESFEKDWRKDKDFIRENPEPKFCSRSCSNKRIKNKNVKTCQLCKKEFIKKRNRTGKFCSNKCCGDFRKKQTIDKFLSGEYTTIFKVNDTIKMFILSSQGNVCIICKRVPEWNGKNLTLICDHIDGNSDNNKPDNLRMICPNCDSQLDTFKNRNKGKGREYRRKNKL